MGNIRTIEGKREDACGGYKFKYQLVGDTIYFTYRRKDGIKKGESYDSDLWGGIIESVKAHEAKGEYYDVVFD